MGVEGSRVRDGIGKIEEKNKSKRKVKRTE
jgi:hypothetical protein